MDLIIHSLKSVATAIIEPMHLVMLLVFGIIFYFKNVRIVSIQKMTLGEGLNTPLELTLSQVVLGILAGAIGSIILSILGVTFSENSGIEFIFMISILSLFYKKKYISYAYSTAILGAIGIVLKIISNITEMKLFLNTDILSLMTFVGVVYILEGVLIIFDGSRGAIPVFTKKEDKIVGGFSFNRYWPIPVAILMIFTNSLVNEESIYFNVASWWPIINNKSIVPLLATAMIASIPLYGIMGYSNVTFTQEKKTKSLRCGISILIYGISVSLVAQLASINILGQIIAIIYTPLAFELIMRYEYGVEKKGEYLYVSDDEGIMVLEVTPNSPAYEVGIKRGDKIIEINGQNIKSEGDIFKAARDSILKVPIKVKNNSGQVLEYIVQPRNKRLGLLLVPKMVKREDMFEIKPDDLKNIINELKNKK
ncbi:MAG: PDZ domain-containing protein [Clostridium celatum]|nr:PDZ domain-containing protein [Clostridium celatum]MDU2121102.1 PDZ domain-containing protein [Clostridium celatum]MDU4978823.1 PDZ domain-containing protein [Clostridium celatum]